MSEYNICLAQKNEKSYVHATKQNLRHFRHYMKHAKSKHINFIFGSDLKQREGIVVKTLECRIFASKNEVNDYLSFHYNRETPKEKRKRKQRKQYNDARNNVNNNDTCPRKYSSASIAHQEFVLDCINLYKKLKYSNSIKKLNDPTLVDIMNAIQVKEEILNDLKNQFDNLKSEVSKEGYQQLVTAIHKFLFNNNKAPIPVTNSSNGTGCLYDCSNQRIDFFGLNNVNKQVSDDYNSVKVRITGILQRVLKAKQDFESEVQRLQPYQNYLKQTVVLPEITTLEKIKLLETKRINDIVSTFNVKMVPFSSSTISDANSDVDEEAESEMKHLDDDKQVEKIIEIIRNEEELPSDFTTDNLRVKSIALECIEFESEIKRVERRGRRTMGNIKTKAITYRRLRDCKEMMKLYLKYRTKNNTDKRHAMLEMVCYMPWSTDVNFTYDAKSAQNLSILYFTACRDLYLYATSVYRVHDWHRIVTELEYKITCIWRKLKAL